MTQHPTEATLLLSILLVIALLLFLILYWKIHAFLALLFSSLTLAVIAGMSPRAIADSVQKGMAELLGSVAVIVGVGAMMGRLIEISRGGEVIAHTSIRILGDKRIPWAFLLVAYLVGIPVFFDAAFITLVPLVWSISKEAKKSELLYALPLLSALTATHGLIPTHPGPAAASQLLGADLGKAVLYGIVLAAPMSIVGGILYGGWISRRIFVEAPENLFPRTESIKVFAKRRPPFLAVLAVVLAPVVLIGSAALAPLLFPSGSYIEQWVKFLGHPFIALLLATGLALVVLGKRLGFGPGILMQHTTEALNSVGSLILIIGASGAFKQVIVDSGAGNSFVKAMLQTKIPPLLMAYLIAAALRFALGSATAAIATAGGIVAPIAASFPNINPVLMVMAVATGGSIVSHVNDAGFWLVKEYCGMSVSQTLRSYSAMKAITSLTGLLGLWVLSRLV